jgi:hypothetical protein
MAQNNSERLFRALCHASVIELKENVYIIGGP